jgi:pimeloyl-ACP methyl ester carboxylesterase
MIKSLLGFAVIAAMGMKSLAADPAPPPEAFRVLTPVPSMGPRITPYLAYQTESAWREDDNRRKAWEGVSEERGLFRLQDEIRNKLLAMIGGLPTQRTPLHPQITGRIQMPGYHIEKLVFESLPGMYVTALVYVPDDKKKHPGILVPCGHAANGKVHYQVLCQRLVRRGYVVICWDPVGQGERSQFWDAKAGKSRYNLICAEHAVLGNLAYLAGTNLARWEIWDGVRAIDYLITRPEVDSERINITGTSGGGFQAAHLAALDKRIKVAVPSCYITALPMRVYNRIFADPDSDPEQDLFGMISNRVDNPGLLLLMYPRPVLVAVGVLDFFPIEGARKTVREVTALYSRFGHGGDISMVEGYHAHQFSDENQEAALDFLDRYNQMPPTRGLPPVTELEEKTLQCTKTGQVMLDFNDAMSLMDSIREYYREHKKNTPVPAATLKELYYDAGYPGVRAWAIGKYAGADPDEGRFSWESRGGTTFDGVSIDRYLLRHSHNLEMPLLHIHKVGDRPQRVLLWFHASGKAAAEDWTQIKESLNAGFDIVSFDFRGLGETRMPYKAVSEDDPELGKLDFDHAYVNPISGILAGYVYNSLLTGRPYFLQMIEDAEIAARFSRLQLHAREFSVAGADDANTLASSIAEVLPGIELLPQVNAPVIKWSGIVEQKREIWPIQYLLPGGAYIH